MSVSKDGELKRQLEGAITKHTICEKCVFREGGRVYLPPHLRESACGDIYPSSGCPSYRLLTEVLKLLGEAEKTFPHYKCLEDHHFDTYYTVCHACANRTDCEWFLRWFGDDGK